MFIEMGMVSVLFDFSDYCKSHFPTLCKIAFPRSVHIKILLFNLYQCPFLNWEKTLYMDNTEMKSHIYISMTFTGHE